MINYNGNYIKRILLRVTSLIMCGVEEKTFSLR
jgi:hypothetical protein